jgi:orotate phosphoribosyltransferase
MSSTDTSPAAALAQDFVRFVVQTGVLRFGEFKTKAGRLSPYFFNAGQFDDGAKLGTLGSFYARRLQQAAPDGPAFDMLFGPAYKGITLAAATAIELARLGRSVPFAYNRKEAKDHGEGGLLVGAPVAGRVLIIDDVISAGTLVGAPVRGRVLIIDDVISAGTSVRESIAMIQASGATPCGVVIALDRQERAAENGNEVPWSATQYVQDQLGLPVLAIATLADLLAYLRSSAGAELAAHAGAVQAYRERYGV